MKVQRVGIAMAVVNCLNFSQQTFRSLVPPPGVEFIWIVIDNGSIDYSYQWFKDQNTESMPVTVIRHEHNTGVHRAWNSGIYMAWKMGCDVVLVTGNDLVFHKDAVGNMIRWIEEDGEAFVTVAPVATEPGILEKITLSHEWHPYPSYVAFMLTREITEKNLWFDETLAVPEYCGDWFHHESLIAAGIPAGHVRDAVVAHYGSRTITEGGVQVGDAQVRNQARFIREFGYDPSTWPKRPENLPPVPARRGRVVA